MSVNRGDASRLKNRRTDSTRAKLVASRIAVLDAFAAGDRVKYKGHEGTIIEVRDGSALLEMSGKRWKLDVSELTR